MQSKHFLEWIELRMFIEFKEWITNLKHCNHFFLDSKIGLWILNDEFNNEWKWIIYLVFIFGKDLKEKIWHFFVHCDK